MVTMITLSLLSNLSRAEPIPEGSKTDDDLKLSQLFYPPVSEDPTFRVVGKGEASLPADQANLLFKFVQNYNYPPEGVLSQFETLEEPITVEMLQPIVDALKEIGVSDEAINVDIVEPSGSFLPFPFPSTATEGGAQLVVIVDNPSRDRLEEIVNVAKDTASPIEEILLSSIDVEYSVRNCQDLEQAAYQSAVDDARNRANSIASAMGAKLKPIPSVAEPFYSIFLPGCSSEGNLPFDSSNTSAYDADAPVEVKVTKEIFVIYTVR